MQSNNKNSKYFILLVLVIESVQYGTAIRTCHQCAGINCLRTTLDQVQTCNNEFDLCISVFQGETIQAQGCMDSIPEELRSKCESSQTDEIPNPDELEYKSSECYVCYDNLCNNLAASSFQCIQCDSKTDSNCRSNPEILAPSRCPISRTPNQYCYARTDGDNVVRGCSATLEEQRSCLSSENCLICQPSDLAECNRSEFVSNNGGSVTTDPNTTASTAPQGSTATTTQGSTATTTTDPNTTATVTRTTATGTSPAITTGPGSTATSPKPETTTTPANDANRNNVFLTALIMLIILIFNNS